MLLRPKADWTSTRCLVTVVVLGLAAVVHFAAGRPSALAADEKSAVQQSQSDMAVAAKSATVTQNGQLPKNVAEMRDALLAAARSGDIEELIIPLEWNELPPAISKSLVDDPISYWKEISSDGKGHEVLAILSELLRFPAAKLNVGSDYENNALYVWPYLAETRLDSLTPAQQVELRTLVPPEVAEAILTSKKWSWWRLSIGADGTWHAFMRFER